MTLDELETRLKDLRDRDGNYIERRSEAAELLLEYITDSISDHDRIRRLNDLYEDTVT